MSNDEKKERIQSQWGENRTLLSLTGERWNIKENIWQKIKINMNYIQAQSLVPIGWHFFLVSLFSLIIQTDSQKHLQF